MSATQDDIDTKLQSFFEGKRRFYQLAKEYGKEVESRTDPLTVGGFVRFT
jgi:hypothetical protein